MLTWMIGNKQWWFRLLGRGIAYKDLRHHRLVFSERHGYARYFRVGPHCFRYLSKESWG